MRPSRGNKQNIDPVPRLEMPGRPPRRGRGGRGGRGGKNVVRDVKSSVARGLVAMPAVSELPTSLHIAPSLSSIPSQILSALPEFRKSQPFFSILERLQPEFGGSTEHHDKCWLGMNSDAIKSVSHDGGFYATINTTDDQEQPVFVKRIHLLDPISAMEGEYVWPEDGSLPAPSDLWKTALAKINDPMNEAYVDALFATIASRLVESNISPHWCRCYGTFTARVEKYLYNITEEFNSMRNEPWWRRNQRLGLFRLHKENEDKVASTQFFTEGLSSIDVGDFENVESDNMVSEKESEIIETDPPISPTEAKPFVLTAPKLRLKRIERAEDSDSGSDDSDDESEIEQYVEFDNFPVQVTLLEKAEGTLEDLLESEDDDLAETKEERWTAWTFQIIAALASAQHWFGFVHNDLHSNNVMWSGTGITHVYYRVHKGKESWILKVPTYGRMLKIIDFGRASFHLPDPAGFFMSDAFYPGNDAATQYNCEPFYDSSEGKKVEPNPSFDLCRLSVSMIESLFEERPANATPVKVMSRESGKIYAETVSPVYNMLWEWLQDDGGKNVLRLPSGEERYPDFDLYRILAAEVHKAIPCRQIERALFKGFQCADKDIPAEEKVYDLYI